MTSSANGLAPLTPERLAAAEAVDTTALAEAVRDRPVHPALSDVTAHCRALIATAWLVWAATYSVLVALVPDHLAIVDCAGLATSVTAVVLAALGLAWACGGESATLDPALWVGGQARPWARPWAVLHGATVGAVIAVTLWRLL